MQVFENCYYIGPDLKLKRQNLYISTVFTNAADSSISIDSSDYLMLPGFINCGLQGSSFQHSLMSGCTTVCLLDSPGAGLPFARMANNNFRLGDCSITASEFSVTLDNSKSSMSAGINQDFYASVFSDRYSYTIWDYLKQNALLNLANGKPMSFILENVSSKPASFLGLKCGSIQQDYMADFILFKLSPEFLVDTQTALTEIFLKKSMHDIEAVFKEGKLIHSSAEFEVAYKTVLLQRYYEKDGAAVTEAVSNLDSIDMAIEAFKRGEYVIAVDNLDRENEGDLMIPGQDFTTEKAAFMIRYTSGVICASASPEIIDRLELPQMVAHNDEKLKTAYTISIDAKNTTTGISARDRSTTIRLMASSDSKASDFSRPGHVFPLRAVAGGVLKRVGHTEASLDLCKLAGKQPVAAICEIVLDDGRMARRDDLFKFAKLHNLVMISISDLLPNPNPFRCWRQGAAASPEILMLFLGVYCQSINLQNTGSVQAGAAKITANALAYYTTSPGSDGMGAVRPNTRQDAQGIQWYESGIYWGAVLEYSRVFKDEKFINIAGTALGLASYGKTGSFLGSNALVAATLMGRWNDDIAWWGLATVTGAEIFGKDAKMPNGQTYLFVSENTYKQVWEQWDTTTCEGGIYWSRDRVTQDKRQGYKSAITNAQMIMLAARLYLLTNNPTYITQANQVYTWMRRGLISRDWIVYDGLDANQRCGMNIDKQSYKAGTMIGALAWMFKATGNESYLRDAGNMLTTAIREFSKDGMLADQCEPNCAKNAVQAKGTYIRGLGYLAALTTIQADRDRIRTHLTTAMQGMLKTCDANLQCGTNWLVGQREVSDFHKQTNAMELISAYTMAMAGSLSNAKFSAPKAKDDESSAGSLSVAAAISAALLL